MLEGTEEAVTGTFDVEFDVYDSHNNPTRYSSIVIENDGNIKSARFIPADSNDDQIELYSINIATDESTFCPPTKIKFVGGEDVRNSVLSSWVSSAGNRTTAPNSTPSIPTNHEVPTLANTTWTMNGYIDAVEAQTGNYDINFQYGNVSINGTPATMTQLTIWNNGGDPAQDRRMIGLSGTCNAISGIATSAITPSEYVDALYYFIDGDTYPTNSIYLFDEGSGAAPFTGWSTSSTTIKILGGTDATNETLIAWFEENGTQVDSGSGEQSSGSSSGNNLITTHTETYNLSPYVFDGCGNVTATEQNGLYSFEFTNCEGSVVAAYCGLPGTTDLIEGATYKLVISNINVTTGPNDTTMYYHVDGTNENHGSNDEFTMTSNDVGVFVVSVVSMGELNPTYEFSCNIQFLRID